jgi:hypothetical protein
MVLLNVAFLGRGFRCVRLQRRDARGDPNGIFFRIECSVLSERPHAVCSISTEARSVVAGKNVA